MKLIGGEAIHSPEFHKKRQKEKRVRRFIIAGLALLLVVAPLLILRNENFLLANIEIEGNSVTHDEDITGIVKEHISGKYLWVLPKSNALLYPRKAIKKDLLARIPRISRVEIEAPTANSLHISVEEREPLALYCTDISNLSNPEGCYFLDKEGFIFSEAPAFSGNVYFIYTKPEVIAEPLGKQYLPAEIFRPFPEFVKSLENLGVHARALEAKADEFNLILPNSGRIIWRAADDLSIIRSNLEAFLADDSISNNFLDRVLYIDLRFENKVFYKFQS